MISRKIVYISVIIGLIVAAIIGLIVWQLTPSNTNVTCQSEERKDVKLIPFEQGLVIKKNLHEILIFDPHTSHLKSFNYSTSNITGYDIYLNKTLYYAHDGNDSDVTSLLPKYANVQSPELYWKPTITTVEFITKKIYVYDKQSKRIDLFDMQGKFHGIVYSDVVMVKDIVLDPYGALMFILLPKSVLMATMNGIFKKELTFKEFTVITAITIDPKNGILYASNGTEIICFNYNKMKISFETFAIEGEIKSMALLGNKLYSIIKNNSEKAGTLFDCKLTISECQNEYEKIIGKAEQVKAFDTSNFEKIKNPCESMNGGCQQFCILSNNTMGRVCECEVGYVLTSDLKNCVLVEEYMMYIIREYLRGRITDFKKTTFTEATLPKYLIADQWPKNKWIYFDYNAHGNYIIFGEDKHAYRLDLQDHGQQWLLHEEESYYYNFRPIIDWITDNLYYIRQINDSSYIMVRDTNSGKLFYQQKTIYSFSREHQAIAMAIHPNHGHLFLTLLNSTSGKVEILKINTDGTSPRLFLSGNDNISVNEISLGIDYFDDRLYWFNKKRTKIQYASLNSSDIKSIEIEFIEEPIEINVYRQWLHVSNRKATWRMHKLTGDAAEIIIRSSFTSEKELHLHSAVKGFGPSLQPINPDHPCLFNNGDCERFCFAHLIKNGTFKRSCACRNHEKLLDDEKECVLIDSHNQIKDKKKLKYR